MPTTPLYGWPSPKSVDPNDVPIDMASALNAIEATLSAQLTALTKAWSAFNPEWDGGSALSIGNGAISGRYKLIGKSVFGQITLVRGSTTNVGVSYYSFKLPVTPRSFRDVQGSGTVNSSIPVNVEGIGSSRVALVAPTGGRIGPANPGSWASGNTIVFGFSYESA